jgi:hypothetical protein
MIPKLLVTSLVACKAMRACAPGAQALKEPVRECAPGSQLAAGRGRRRAARPRAVGHVPGVCQQCSCGLAGKRADAGLRRGRRRHAGRQVLHKLPGGDARDGGRAPGAAHPRRAARLAHARRRHQPGAPHLPRFVSQDMCSGLHSCSWHQPNMSQASACHVPRRASCVLQDVKVACMRDGACTEPQRGSAAATYCHHCCRHCCKVSLKCSFTAARCRARTSST